MSRFMGLKQRPAAGSGVLSLAMVDSQVVAWIDERLAEMLRAPRMWGSLEAVEMQALLLAELRAFARDPASERQNPRRVLGLYVAHMSERFPADAPRPLHEIVAGDESRFVAELAAFLRATGD